VLDAVQLRHLVAKLHSSKTCQDADLVDPILVFIATGLRRSELLALRWGRTLTRTPERWRYRGRSSG
jgi:integrase